jgi:hypothetical protein
MVKICFGYNSEKGCNFGHCSYRHEKVIKPKICQSFMSREGCKFGYKCKYDHMRIICQAHNSKKGCKIGRRHCFYVHELYTKINKIKQKLSKMKFEKTKIIGTLKSDVLVMSKIKSSKNLLELFESKI